MNSVDAMYLCTTPFQIMSAISLVINMNETADIYIDPQFSNAQEYASRLKELRLFRNVVVLSNIGITKRMRNSGKVMRSAIITGLYLWSKSFCGKFLIKDTYYNKMYISNNGFYANILKVYFGKHKIDTEVIYFDDGEGSYDNERVFNESRNNDRLKKLLGIKKEERSLIRFLYFPFLYKALNSDSKDIIKQLPFWDSNKRVEESIIYIFGKAEPISEKYIILDTMPYEWMDAVEAEEYIELIKHICDQAGIDQVCIKKHPRDKASYGEEYKEYSGRSTPFECICLSTNMENKVLITLSSTAVLTPKMLFDQEPYIILLYKLFSLKSANDERRDRLYYNIANNYNKSERVMIPETFEELSDILIKL